MVFFFFYVLFILVILLCYFKNLEFKILSLITYIYFMLYDLHLIINNQDAKKRQ